MGPIAEIVFLEEEMDVLVMGMATRVAGEEAVEKLEMRDETTVEKVEVLPLLLFLLFPPNLAVISSLFPLELPARRRRSENQQTWS
jgi:hypothetical protein